MGDRKTVTRKELAAALHRLHEKVDGCRYTATGFGYEWEGEQCEWEADAIFRALPESADEGLRTAALMTVNRIEAAVDCYWGGKENGCDHEPLLREAAAELRAALAATLPEPGEES